MTITFAEYSSALGLTLSDARSFAELLAIAVLIVVLTQREAIRGRPSMWAAAGQSGLMATAVPLGLAWVVVMVERFAVLLR